MAFMLAAFSILSLYVETILQIYVILTCHAIAVHDVPIAMASLAMTLMAFIIASIASFILTLRSADFSGKALVKVLFAGSHLLGVGLLWKIFKLILSFSERDLRQLSVLRLVHVVFQSAPYVVLYTRFFVNGNKINVIQTLSLLASTGSSALALTSYSLRHKLSPDSWEDKLPDEVSTRQAYGAIGVTILGTVLVLATRFASISLMAVQQNWHVAIPTGIHFIIILCIFIISARQKDSTEPKGNLISDGFYCLAMSLLNTFDLVHDNIDRVMCKYVGFYTLILAENIVLLSFWLLGSDTQYVAKLITVVGILGGFIVGLTAKFVGCNMLTKVFGEMAQAPSLSTSGTSPDTLTSASRTTFESPSLSHGDEDDLISIVQASMVIRSLRNAKDVSNMGSCSSNTRKGHHRRRIESLTLQGNQEMYSLQSLNSVQHSTISSHTNSCFQTSCKCYRCHAIEHSTISNTDPGQSDHGSYLHLPTGNDQNFAKSTPQAAEFCAKGDFELQILSAVPEWTGRIRVTASSEENRTRNASSPVWLGHHYCGQSDSSPQCNDQYPAKNILSRTSHTGSSYPSTLTQSCPSHENKEHRRPKQISYISPETIENSTVQVHKRQITNGFNTMPDRKIRPPKINHEFGSSHTPVSSSAIIRPKSTAVKSLPATLRGNEVATALQKQDKRKWVLTPTAFHPDQASSSVLSTSVTQNSSDSSMSMTSTELTSQPTWLEDNHSTISWPPALKRFRSKPQLALPSESSKVSSCENILKWLADTERSIQEVDDAGA